MNSYYLYESKILAQNLIDELTKIYGDNIPYTAISESNNGKGYAIKCDEFTKKVTDETPQDLPKDFFIYD